MKFPSSTPLAAFASLVLLCCNFAAAQNIDHEVAVKQPVDAKVAGLMLYYTRKRSYDTMFFVVNEYATAGDDEEIIAQYLCIYTHGHMRFMREYAEVREVSNVKSFWRFRKNPVCCSSSTEFSPSSFCFLKKKEKEKEKGKKKSPLSLSRLFFVYPIFVSKVS